MVLFFFFLMIRRPPRSTLFPYTDALPIWLQNKTGTCMFKVCNNPNLCNKHKISAFWLRSDGTSISKNILWSTGYTQAWYVLFDLHSIFILPSNKMKWNFPSFLIFIIIGGFSSITFVFYRRRHGYWDGQLNVCNCWVSKCTCLLYIYFY